MTSIRNLPTPRPAPSADHWDFKVTDGYASALADRWTALYGDDNEREKAFDTMFRGSMAANCMRQLGYYALGEPLSDPPTPADLYRMHIGELLHGWAQHPDVFGDDAIYEVPWQIERMDISGHADVVVPDAVIEMKSAGGFKFKMSGVFNNADGPNDSALLQAGFAAEALGLSTVVIIMLGLEVVNRGDTDKYALTDNERWILEWHYPLEYIEPLMVKAEARHLAVKEFLAIDTLPPRHHIDMPAGAQINRPLNPSGKATWTLHENNNVVDQGTHWACDYCRYQTRCQSDLDAQSD